MFKVLLSQVVPANYTDRVPLCQQVFAILKILFLTYRTGILIVRGNPQNICFPESAMKITAVIAEYNPFHNGHAYHLEKAREMTGADAVIVLMSGDFVQRGEPAVIDKYARTEAALAAGADAVFMMPVQVSTGSAEEFAHGAVSVLDRMHAVSALCYGAETADNDSILRTAVLLQNEPVGFRDHLMDLLAKGETYPAAVSAALEAVCPGYGRLLDLPNNTLAVAYNRALLRLGSAITPYAVCRLGSDHNDRSLPTGSLFASAASIRKGLTAGDDMEKYVTPAMAQRLTYHISADDLSSILNYVLLMSGSDDLRAIPEISEDLASRILAHAGESRLFSEWVPLIKTRNVTYARVSRALLHLILGLTGTEEPSSVRLLGFRKQSSEVLRILQDASDIPIVTKLAAAGIPDSAADIRAARLYAMLAKEKAGILLGDEYLHSPIII